jgi:DNA-binding CsgD family transcriptional regulator
MSEADPYLRAGIDYCLDHDLDSWRLYMTAWLARSQAEQGRYPAAHELARDVLRHPHLSPISEVVAAVVAGQLAARTDGRDDGHLARAVELAERTGETQRLVPVAAALAEAAWLAGDAESVVAAVDRAWSAAVARPQRWELGELAWWLALAGERRYPPAPIAQPFADMVAGRWRAAHDEWQRLRCPLWSAWSLALSPSLDDARTALQIVDAIGAPAVRAAIVRDRHAAGLPVPRGPRAATRENTWGLTVREVEILGLLTEGSSNAEVARRLYLSEKTVGHHVSSILRKLGEPTRSRAVARAMHERIVGPT